VKDRLLLSSQPIAPGSCRPEIEILLTEGKNHLLAALEPTPLRFAPGDALMRLGEEHEYLYVVEEGWLARSRTLEDGRRQIMVLFLSGDFCGIKTMFLERQPDAIEALTPAIARRIHYRAASTLAAGDFAVAMFLAWQLALDERHLHNWVVRLGRGDAEERLAALLLEIRERMGARGLDVSRGYALPITQQQIADHIGLTVVHVNRVLRRFRQLEMVALQRGRVLLLDNFAALEDAARPVQDVTV
jgi:CRP-like cAMP-binding protein